MTIKKNPQTVQTSIPAMTHRLVLRFQCSVGLALTIKKSSSSSKAKIKLKTCPPLTVRALRVSKHNDTHDYDFIRRVNIFA